MIFSTPIFVFGFLPVFLAVYYLAPKPLKTYILLIGSCVFYAWWQAIYLVLVLAIAMLSYMAGHIAVHAQKSSTRKWAVWLGVAGNLLFLGWFKYAYFVAGIFEDAVRQLGAEPGGVPELPEIILPIGLSFLVFQSISYILDVARGDAPPASRVVDFLAFSTLFPQLIAGPILRYKDLADQFRSRDNSLEQVALGTRRFVTGLAMKLLIADSVAPLVDRLFLLSAPTAAEAWLAATAYAVQLFFDFAGYSAMAIGLGLMLGFRFIENFDSPYISRSVTEFWKRWHISLSTWLRDYLYVPLGGNRSGAIKTYRNLILTMVLGGLWHGANWTFLMWGFWHGTIMAIERALGSKSRDSVWPSRVAWPITMVFVLIGWVIFRAETVSQAFTIYGGMVGSNGLALTAETLLLLRPTEIIFLLIGGFLSVKPMLDGRTTRPAKAQTVPWGATLASSFGTLALFLCCAAIMQARLDSPFLYFQF